MKTSGKAVQRAFRGHLLIDQCITQQIVEILICEEANFANLLHELEMLYTKTEKDEMHFGELTNSECLKEIDRMLSRKKMELSAHSDTCKLWLGYQQMLGVARQLIAADRKGLWQMHLHTISACLPIFAAAGHSNYLKTAYLYIQSMRRLEGENPSIFP